MLKKHSLPRATTSFVFLILLFIGVGLINSSFLTLQNIMLNLNSSVIYTVVAIGIAFVIITGEIDVSVGATLGISAAICGTMVRDGNPVQGIIIALLVGLFIGLFNGFGVTVLRIPSIIMTLGANGIIRGMIYVYTNGKWIENIPLEFKALAQAKFLGIFTWFYFATLVAMVLIYLYMTRTRTGRYFKAVGDNPNGANLLGIPVVGTKIVAFVLCGLFASIGGIMYVSRVGFITPIAGNGYEMKVIAACVLGGISLTGGVGSVIGATIGAAIMASISRALVFLGFPSDYDNTITGILLIVVVVFDSVLQITSAEKVRRQRLSAKIVHAEISTPEAVENEK
ncbi:MAG: ABC transporter permease [Spirochaetales bacterium]|nr:ABC transporter permease [Spirochaetales bacterium]